jgi:hypothetical protein
MTAKPFIAILAMFALLAPPVASGQTSAPQPPQPDILAGYAAHRAADVFFGFIIAAPAGMATRPWIGLAAGEVAGVANEAHYGKNFNVGHLAFISAGVIAGYGLAKWERHKGKSSR